MTKPIKAKTSVNNGWVQPKPRKRRKPMTPEQKAAAAERLAKARAFILKIARIRILPYLYTYK